MREDFPIVFQSRNLLSYGQIRSANLNSSGLNYTVPALVFETKIFSVIAMCQAFAPLLLKAQGTIFQLASIAGVRHPES
ncbi:hypothetical protein ACO22_06895 [Paracoccidioides brasiliensis]|uniref:Uncharacterized protein n=1 Tax=Paracoccidioides brasiliensis TaxID=121759 RepID=A0A1D2J681_PARBR|nr:hypothetical protein ACO22_06895 [Paracoccidioides brasiliensis]